MSGAWDPAALELRLAAVAPFPAVGLELLALVGDEDVGIDEVVATVGKDASLAARLLRYANSALLTRAEPASTVHDAVRTLGAVGSLRYLTTDLSRATLAAGAAGYGQDGRKLWMDAVVGARAAAELAAATDVPPSLAYTAALMRDLGKLVLAADVAALGPRAGAGADDTDAPDFTAAERAIFSLDHAAVGAELAARWRFPPHLVEAIRFHHRPSQTTGDLAALVHAGDIVATLAGASGYDNRLTPVDEGVLQRLGLDELSILDLVVLAGQWVAELASDEG